MTQRSWTRRLAAALCVLLLAPALLLPARAAEGTLSCTYVPITGDGFVAETMNGVESRYNLYGPTLQCVELVIRYYLEVYGLEIRCAQGNVTVIGRDDLRFVETDDPQPGDILFGSAAARGKGYDHWALVRSNHGDSLTLFEQNWRWNGQAGVSRVISFPTTCYRAYTLVDGTGAAVEPLEDSPAAVSAWAEPYLERAAQAGIDLLETDFQSAVTREDFCRMALNVLEALGTETADGGTACERAAAMGLITGGDGGDTVNRQEAAVITARVLALLGELPEADLTVLDNYLDGESIASWAAPAVAQMTACGLLSGSAGRFDPRGELTNEAAAALLMRVYENPTPAVLMQAEEPEGPEAPPAGRKAAVCAAMDVVALGAGNMMLTR